jgi:multidrug efflux pump subunit AcrA (membrane-fusion protein)
MKKTKISIILIALGTTLALTACGSSGATNNGKKPTTTTKQTSNAIDASGTVEASNVENISLNFSEEATPTVTKINVKEGQTVKKGDTLATLDMTNYNDTIASKQRAIDADVDTKKTLQTDDEKKIQQDKIDSEQDELNSLEAGPGLSHVSGNAVVSDMDNAVVTNVAGSSSSLGQSASPSSIVTLEDLNSLYIQANVSEDFINSVAVGKTVTITSTSDPNTKLTGKVTSIASEAVLDKNGDTNVPVNISIDNNNGKLFPNYNVDVEISK